jgi:hypothetical protein
VFVKAVLFMGLGQVPQRQLLVGEKDVCSGDQGKISHHNYNTNFGRVGLEVQQG